MTEIAADSFERTKINALKKSAEINSPDGLKFEERRSAGQHHAKAQLRLPAQRIEKYKESLISVLTKKPSNFLTLIEEKHSLLASIPIHPKRVSEELPLFRNASACRGFFIFVDGLVGYVAGVCLNFSEEFYSQILFRLECLTAEASKVKFNHRIKMRFFDAVSAGVSML